MIKQNVGGKYLRCHSTNNKYATFNHKKIRQRLNSGRIVLLLFHYKRWWALSGHKASSKNAGYKRARARSAVRLFNIPSKQSLHLSSHFPLPLPANGGRRKGRKIQLKLQISWITVWGITVEERSYALVKISRRDSMISPR